MRVDEYKLGLIESTLRFEDWRNTIRHDEVVVLTQEIRCAWKFISGLADECASRDLRLRALDYLGRKEAELVVECAPSSGVRSKSEASESITRFVDYGRLASLVRIIVECHEVKPNQHKTHHESCHLFHPECAIALMAREINKLLSINKNTKLPGVG